MTAELDALRREHEALKARLARLEAAHQADDAGFLRSVLDAIPAIIAWIDPDARIRFLNRYLSGFEPADVVGRPVYDFVDPASVPTARSCIERALRTGEQSSYVIVGAGADGALRHYQTVVAPVPERDGKRGACLISLDVTEQLEREAALRSSEETLKVALAATKMGVWRWERATNRVAWSDSMRALTGYDGDIDPQTYVDQIVHPEDREALTQAMQRYVRGFEQQWLTHRIVRPDGSVRWVLPTGQATRDAEGKLLMVVGGSLDITAQRAIEERLRQTQKLEALGSLTAGVAHNFNNMLAVILPYLDQAVHGGHDDRELALLALQAAQRASQMIRQLMMVAGKRGSRRKIPCDLVKIVETGAEICRPILQGEIALTLEVPQAPLWVDGDEAELEQVIVNLCLNAKDALSEVQRDHPHIHIALDGFEGDAGTPAAGRGSAYARISIRDNGPGMDEAVQARLFEPFFTTKGPEKGTGLGLATSRSVVREHGGTMLCESAPGEGTTFNVYLPLVDLHAGLRRRATSTLRAPRHSLRILLVDDEAAVRSATRAMLEGHVVIEAASAEDALRRLEADLPFDLILLDRTMPQAAGTTLLNDVRRLVPQARVLYFTGGDVPEDERQRVDGVLHKPITRSGLNVAIAAVMKAKQGNLERIP